MNVTNEQVTNATGGFSFPILSIAVNTQYRVQMPERPQIVSPIVTVGVKPYVKSKVNKKRVKRGKRIRFSGTVKPAAADQQIAIQKWNGDAVGDRRRHAVRSSGKFSKNLKIRRGGSYRVWTGSTDGPVRLERRQEVQDPFIQVSVEFAERYWYPDDGGQVWLSGYQLVDPATGSYLARDAPLLAERGLHVAGLAGARHRGDALASDALAPGSPLELRRDPGNEHDANAIEVHAGGAQVGFVPRELAAELAAELDAGRPWSAVVLREQRASPRDPRSGRDDAARARGGDRAPRPLGITLPHGAPHDPSVLPVAPPSRLLGVVAPRSASR